MTVPFVVSLLTTEPKFSKTAIEIQCRFILTYMNFFSKIGHWPLEANHQFTRSYRIVNEI